ncbi:hypothetical protein VUR80DRAFT_3665 [Thermomyces stellatus]
MVPKVAPSQVGVASSMLMRWGFLGQAHPIPESPTRPHPQCPFNLRLSTRTDVALSSCTSAVRFKAEMFGNRWVLLSRHVIHPSARRALRRLDAVHTYAQVSITHAGSNPVRLSGSTHISG